MSELEHRILIILTANETLMGRIVWAYKQGVKPSDQDIAAFMEIPAITFLRRQHTDYMIVKALTNVIDDVMRRMERPDAP